MNFVGHVHIAQACLDHHGAPATISDARSSEAPPATLRYLLGTALPDFAAIGRFQTRYPPADAAVRVGVAAHHATDGAFHDNDWFIAQSKALSTDLRDRGINRGAARACGHVGIELLVDGNLLLQHPELARRSQEVLKTTAVAELQLDELVDETDRHRWQSHLRRIGDWTVPTDYHQPWAVAERLERILSHRPRLAFTIDEVPIVSDALQAASEHVVAGLEELVESVSQEVAVELSDLGG